MIFHTDMRAISQALAARSEDLAIALLDTLPTSASKATLRFRSRGSLAVTVTGEDRGKFYDHESAIGGDCIDLICHIRNCNRAAAARWGATWLAGASHQTVPKQPASRSAPSGRAGTNLAQAIWQEAKHPAASPVERYLESRGLAVQPDAPLRYHPACPRGHDRLPAMVALMTNSETNQPTGIHRTFLSPDGSGKAEVSPAKMMLGNAGVIRLAPDENVTMGLGLSEGIETGLAIIQHCGWQAIWAASSAGAIANFPVLDGIESLSIFADADDDGVGLKSAKACGQRWIAAGKEVTIHRPPAGTDWHDALEGHK